MNETPTHVLIVEDNPGDARLIEESLREARGAFVVEHADRLAHALERLRDGGVDVVLLDLSLPDASGLETFRRASEHAGEAAIIVLTGLDDEQMAVAAVNAGAQDYLPKSRIDGDVLGRSITYSIERHRLVTELRKLDAAKTQFIADAAHELRTPLTTLAGFAQMIGRHGSAMSKEQLDDAITAIGRQSEHVAALVGNLLDLSQIDAGRLNVTARDVNVARAAARAVDIAGVPPGYDVRVDVGDAVCARADPNRLDQVLVNLLTNAYRYGGRSIRVSGAIDGAGVVVTVSDDGDGVPEEIVRTLFDPFARGPNAGRAKGSGLGLAIVRRLVRAMDGDVWYEGAHPRGAAFHVRLPAS